MGEIFSIVPLEVWADKRLTLKQMRVLGVLFSFRGKNTDTVWPSRAQIAERRPRQRRRTTSPAMGGHRIAPAPARPK